ncbi:MAG: oligosaccharide flippase family protein [Phycisphaerales bacterium]|nr:oligosaccharide flippase family protein [Phycisphaerales bacterium]
MSDAPRPHQHAPTGPTPHAHDPTDLTDLPPPPEQPAPAARPASGTAPALGRAAVSGAAWMTLLFVSGKLVGMVQQVVLALLLVPDDFGVIGLAMAITSFPAMLQSAGLSEILIQRQRRFGVWATPAFWMSLATAAAAAALMMTLGAFAPAALGSSADNPQLFGVIVINALSCFATAPLAVPLARLYIDMRFRFVAVYSTLLALAATGMAIGLASLGFRAASVALPPLILAVPQLVVLWRASGARVSWRPHFGRWRYLWTDAGLLLGTGLIQNVTAQGDRLILAHMQPEKVLGLYFVAYNLSTRTITQLTEGLTRSLFPAMAQLQNEPVRLLRASLRACRLLNFFAAPACFGQAAVAAPVFRIAFRPEYHGAIPIFQILSIGTAFVVVASPTSSLMKAQGRFMALMLWSAFASLAFVGAMAAGGAVPGGGANAIAASVALFFAVFVPAGFYVAIRPMGGRWADVAWVYVLPLVLSVAAVAVPWYLSGFIPEGMPLRPWFQIGFIGAWSSVAYIALLRVAAPEDWHEILHRLTPMLPGRVRGLVRSRLSRARFVPDENLNAR